MTQEEIFWSWFRENNSKYYFLNQVTDTNKKEKLLDDFLERLHLYCNKIFFEIGGMKNEEQELIISAGGNKYYFEKVEKLVSKAPRIEGWHIFALKPPMGIDFISNYGSIELNPNKMWFLPLDNEKEPKSLGLKIYLENYTKKDNTFFLNASYQILATILGEKSATLDINYLEVDKMPKNPEKKGLIELSELSKYIAWRKRQ